MTNVTTILANESGIQYQGVEDRTSGTGSYPVIGLITGSFKRGRFDKPMTITSRNIRGQLGYDPKNPHYQAVEDVLKSGVPSVQVLRVLSGNGGTCVGATQSIILGIITSGGYYNVKINGNVYSGVFGFENGREDLKTVFIENDIEVVPLNSSLNEVIPDGVYYNFVEYARFTNRNTDHVEVEISIIDANEMSEYIPYPEGVVNRTVQLLGRNDGVKFCLSEDLIEN